MRFCSLPMPGLLGLRFIPADKDSVIPELGALKRGFEFAVDKVRDPGGIVKACSAYGGRQSAPTLDGLPFSPNDLEALRRAAVSPMSSHKSSIVADLAMNRPGGDRLRQWVTNFFATSGFCALEAA